MKKSGCVLAFIANRVQGASVSKAWLSRSDLNRIVICLDEATFPPDEARDVFDDKVKLAGLSDLQLSPKMIMQESLSLVDDIFPSHDQSLPGQVEEWMRESLSRWLLLAVHSVRAFQSACHIFNPERIVAPEYSRMILTTRPDEVSDNPLFFDLLPGLCRRAGIVLQNSSSAKSGWVNSILTPVKYIAGQWVDAFRHRRRAPVLGFSSEPILIGNLGTDFHPHFDLNKMGRSVKGMIGWLRRHDGEYLIQVEKLIECLGLPETTGGWSDVQLAGLATIGRQEKARIRLLAGLMYYVQLLFHRWRQNTHLRSLLYKYDVPWVDLLFSYDLPPIHAECRLAAAFFCLFEYERARSILLKTRPKLFVTSGDHWTYLPHIAAAHDLEIISLSTASGINFWRDDFTRKCADFTCVYGEATALEMRQRYPGTKIILAGDVLNAVSGETVVTSGSNVSGTSRVLLVTSGKLYGWWFGSLLFDYPAYRQALSECADLFRAMQPRIEVVIKSHPRWDLHDLYDQVVRENSDIFVEHCRAPLSRKEVEGFDAAVVFSTGTTFIAELIRANVPIVFFSGGQTEFGCEFLDCRELLEAKSPKEVAGYLSCLGDPQESEFRLKTINRGKSLIDRYISAERSFDSVVSEILGDNRTPHGSFAMGAEMAKPV